MAIETIKPLNVKRTFDLLRGYGLSVRRTDGEWRINVPGGTEVQAYYTTDNDDACDTGFDIACRWHEARKQPGYTGRMV